MPGSQCAIPAAADTSRVNHDCLPVSPRQASAGGLAVGGSLPSASLKPALTMAPIFGPHSLKS